jgi:hypothetical protein
MNARGKSNLFDRVSSGNSGVGSIRFGSLISSPSGLQAAPDYHLLE